MNKYDLMGPKLVYCILLSLFLCVEGHNFLLVQDFSFIYLQFSIGTLGWAIRS